MIKNKTLFFTCVSQTKRTNAFLSQTNLQEGVITQHVSTALNNGKKSFTHALDTGGKDLGPE